MECFLVGGAVRDELLGAKVTDRDWVVVGATPTALLAEGYTQVGRDFPVFLHPQTREEYALARTERKTAPGHRGFVVHAGVEVTLEEDLQRRDLTINAMAKTVDGRFIDPFNGQRDLEDRVLRHVSPAFEEDPLRVFRVARFAAVLDGFALADETRELMIRMCDAGRLRELSAERVAQELLKMLRGGGQPRRFFAVLETVGGMTDWFEEWVGVDVPELATALMGEAFRYAVLCSPLTREQVLRLGQRLRLKAGLSRLAAVLAERGSELRQWQALPPTKLEQALTACGAFRTDSLLEPLATLCRLQWGQPLAPLPHWVAQLEEDLTAKDFLAAGHEPGPALGQALRRGRYEALEALRQQFLAAAGESNAD